MHDQHDLEALEAELADKKAMLADLESGRISLGGPFENRETGVRLRIEELERQIRVKKNASRT